MRFDHAGLAVADLAAAARWYCAAFGYARELTLRVEPIELDIEMLRHPDDGHRLELLHRRGSGGAHPGGPAEAALRAGFGHVALDVPDVDAAYAHALDHGARAVMPPGPAPEAGARMAFVADPEGNLIELLHRTGSP
jgi:lactoylglutathione lyase